MNPPQDYGESILFAFIKGGLILCRWRERFDLAQFSAPECKIDPTNVDDNGYMLRISALIRETLKRSDVKHERRN